MEYGDLRSAWLRAGQSLCRDQSVASRALVLRAILGEGADPRLIPALEELAADAPWRVDWARVKGDVTPPWPGPVAALAWGSGPFEGALPALDHLGTVRLLDGKDASPRGRLAAHTSNGIGLSFLSDGTLLSLDGVGRVRADRTRTVGASRSGIEALLQDEPDEMETLAEELRTRNGTAVSATAWLDREVVAVGDCEGTVRVFGHLRADSVLHGGRVTAVAALGVPVAKDTVVPMLYSGGADGAVRAWAPGHDPLPTPLSARTCGVVALDAAWSDRGPVLVVAWADGLVQLHCVEEGREVGFHPGAPVRAVAVASDCSVVIGMDEALIRLTARLS